MDDRKLSLSVGKQRFEVLRLYGAKSDLHSGGSGFDAQVRIDGFEVFMDSAMADAKYLTDVSVRFTAT